MGERRGVYRIIMGKPEGKGPLGKLRRRWDNYIIMAVQEVCWGRGRDFSGSGYRHMAGTFVYFRVT